MSEWGRKEYRNWPSRKPLASYGALFFAVLFFVGCTAWQYTKNWSFVERFYLPVYAKTWVRGSMSAKNQTRYALLDIVNKKGKQQLALDGQIEPIQNADGTKAYAVTEAAVAHGWVKPVWDAGWYNDRKLHDFLRYWIYQDQTVWDYVKSPTYWSLGVFVLMLFLAVPKDRARRMIWKHGRRLRGPELVTTAEFNEKLGTIEGADDVLCRTAWRSSTKSGAGPTRLSAKMPAAGRASRVNGRRCTS